MRYLYVIALILLLFGSSCTQSRTEMSTQIWELTLKVDSLSAQVAELNELTVLQEEELLWLQNKLTDLNTEKQEKPAVASAKLRPTPVIKAVKKEVADAQCEAITSSGQRCSRTALNGSLYCFQHKQIYEPEMPKKK